MTNPSLQKKSAARMAAVQCLYRQSVTGEAPAPEKQITALKKQLADNRDEQKLLIGAALEPNYKLAETLLTLVHDQQTEIDLRLSGALTGNWACERMSPLLVAILQCAIAEMFFAKEISPKIVIDEYTRLTRSFFAGQEVDFVHGALSRLAEQYK